MPLKYGNICGNFVKILTIFSNSVIIDFSFIFISDIYIYIRKPSRCYQNDRRDGAR